MSTTSEELEAIALRAAQLAVQLYAESHPRPTHVTYGQAADMLDCSEMTISRLVKAGTLRPNRLRRLPIEQVDAMRKAS
jgi:excisionase family DNA binding protein